MTFGKLINTMDILVLELPQFQRLQHSRYACHIFSVLWHIPWASSAHSCLPVFALVFSEPVKVPHLI